MTIAVCVHTRAHKKRREANFQIS